MAAITGGLSFGADQDRVDHPFRGSSVNGFSLRTMFLGVLGFSLLCALLVGGTGASQAMIHLVFVLAFGIPGASYGYDTGSTSRSTVTGFCLASLFGTMTVSAILLAMDWYRAVF